MKTLKRNDEIIRVKEDKVESYLNKGFVYTNKKEWKDKVRDNMMEEPKKDNEQKEVKTNKKEVKTNKKEAKANKKDGKANKK